MYRNNVDIGNQRHPPGRRRGFARIFRAFEWFVLAPYNYWLRLRGIDDGPTDHASEPRRFEPLPHAELTEAQRKAALEEYERQPRIQ